VEKGTTFEIIEDGTGSEVELNDAIDDEGDESGTGTADDGMQVYESFIFGMLTNFDQLPLERIHAMLKVCSNFFLLFALPESNRFSWGR